LTASIRGFWLQLDIDDRDSFNVNHIYPLLYDLPGSDGGRVAVMVSHVEVKKFLICFTDTYPKGKQRSKFDPGSETRSKFSCDPDGTIAVEVRDNTRRVKGAMIDASRRGELTTLCSITEQCEERNHCNFDRCERMCRIGPPECRCSELRFISSEKKLQFSQ
jgi:hypothetical protein